MTDYGYGLWELVIFNSVLMIAFAFSFFRPRSKLDWRAFGGFSAFIVALFTEMYGYPLTIYLLTGPLAGLVPGVNFSHSDGHLLNDLVGWKGNPHLSPFHIASYVVIIAGFWTVYAGWKALFAAGKSGELATTGPYAHVRHPQYLGFILVMAGFLLQWPTLVTLAMFPVLLVVYARLATREEHSVRAEFGDEYDAWAALTPRFWPRWRTLRRAGPPGWALGPRLMLARAHMALRHHRPSASSAEPDVPEEEGPPSVPAAKTPGSSPHRRPAPAPTALARSGAAAPGQSQDRGPTS